MSSKICVSATGSSITSQVDPNVEQDILSITAAHPMREQAVRDLLARSKAEWSVVEKLIAQGQLIRTKYQGRDFYMRKLYANSTQTLREALKSGCAGPTSLDPMKEAMNYDRLSDGSVRSRAPEPEWENEEW